jgi:hypothetical protein
MSWEIVDVATVTRRAPIPLPQWDAHPVIDGTAHYVALERDGVQVGVLPPDVAQGLADSLEDAAKEPARCMRDECEDYAVEGDLCPAHWDRAPRWLP